MLPEPVLDSPSRLKVDIFWKQWWITDFGALEFGEEVTNMVELERHAEAWMGIVPE